MAERDELTTIVWEDLSIAAEYGPYVYQISTEDLSLWGKVYDQSAQADPQISPGLIPIYVLRALRAAFNGIPPGGVLARQTYLFVKPMRVGQELSVTLRVAEKYERRGRPYVVLAFTLRHPDGDLVAQVTKSLIWPRGDKKVGPDVQR